MTYSNESYLFFQLMQNHFIKQGKRETLEKYFRNKLEKRAKLRKTNMYDLFTNAVFSASPFIRLKSKKRRKYTLHKVHVADKQWSRRKGVGSFTRSIKEQKPKDLFSAVEKELTLLQTGKSNIQLKRDEYHKTALKVTPYRWKKLIYTKRKQERFLQKQIENETRNQLQLEMQVIRRIIHLQWLETLSSVEQKYDLCVKNGREDFINELTKWQSDFKEIQNSLLISFKNKKKYPTAKSRSLLHFQKMIQSGFMAKKPIDWNSAMAKIKKECSEEAITILEKLNVIHNNVIKTCEELNKELSARTLNASRIEQLHKKLKQYRQEQDEVSGLSESKSHETNA